MKNGDRSICLVVLGPEPANTRLQPWRYLLEVGRGLECLGYEVTLLSNESWLMQSETLDGLQLVRLPGVRLFPWQASTPLGSALEQIAPDYVLLHLGLTSFIHQGFRLWREWPTVGIFTSPLYSWRKLARLGIGRLWQNRALSAIHLLGVLAPRWLLRTRMRNSGLRALVVQTHTTCRELIVDRLWQGRIEAIPPGVDPAWSQIQPEEATRKRRELGYSSGDMVVGYFGSPAPLRGLPLLVQAIEQARRQQPALKLLALIRRQPGESLVALTGLRRSLNKNGREGYIRLLEGFLPVEELVQCVAACDLVALPFELVPSDAPLSLLEAQALGKLLVTTRVACLPELAAGGPHVLVEPGDSRALASALLQAVGALPQDKQATATSVRTWQAVGQDWAHLLEAL